VKQIIDPMPALESAQENHLFTTPPSGLAHISRSGWRTAPKRTIAHLRLIINRRFSSDFVIDVRGSELIG